MDKKSTKNARVIFLEEKVMPKYHIGLQEALTSFSHLWNELPQAEKDEYKAKERKLKEPSRGAADDRYRKDCFGNNLLEEQEKEKQKEEFEERVRKTSLEYIKLSEKLEIRPFYFVAFEYTLQDDYGNYYPCEVGLVKYSLKRGIEKYVHYFLKPASLPMATKAAAKSYSEKRHKIPYDSFELATDGYSAVFAHIRDVLLNTNSAHPASVNKYPPIYCMPDDVEMNRKCMNTLFKLAQRHPSEQISVIASASLLVKELFGGEDICGESKACEILASSTFDYNKGVACDWHYEKECIYCALATARKFAFALSDSLKTTLNLTLTPQHLPTVETLSWSATHNLVPWSTTPNTDDCGSSVASDSVVTDFKRMTMGRGQGSSPRNAPCPGKSAQKENSDDGDSLPCNSSVGARGNWQFDDDDDVQSNWEAVSVTSSTVQDMRPSAAGLGRGANPFTLTSGKGRGLSK